jgi:hypothetical protein
MGYTHYWKQTRWIKITEWRKILSEIRQIAEFGAETFGISIGDGMGAEGSEPFYDDDTIHLNGVGAAGYEGFRVKLQTKRLAPPSESWTDFCKTGWKPYDPIVTASLCHLSTATRIVGPDGQGVVGTEAFHVTSDGHGKDFVAGLEIARKALPHLAERLDLPLRVMADDLRTSPWIYARSPDAPLRHHRDRQRQLALQEPRITSGSPLAARQDRLCSAMWGSAAPVSAPLHHHRCRVIFGSERGSGLNAI